MEEVTKVVSENNVLVGLRTNDGYIIEAVYTISAGCLCLSTQVGCKTGCVFCASGNKGYIRNLSADEIMEQYRYFEDRNYEISSINFAGIGEPLLNIDNVLEFRNNINIANIQVTTSLPNAESFHKILDGEFDSIIISLHSADNVTRKRIMPNSLSVTQIDEILHNAIAQDENLKNVIRISYSLFNGLNTEYNERLKIIEFAKKHDLKILLMKYNEVNNKPQYCIDEETYLITIKMIEDYGVECEDCVYTGNRKCECCKGSASRCDPVGGCGTLFIKYS